MRDSVEEKIIKQILKVCDLVVKAKKSPTLSTGQGNIYNKRKDKAKRVLHEIKHDLVLILHTIIETERTLDCQHNFVSAETVRMLKNLMDQSITYRDKCRNLIGDVAYIIYDKEAG